MLYISIVKKQMDKSKRTWLVWFLDISKLLICQFIQHIINLIVSSKIGANNGLGCEWYIINLLIDSTIGIALQYCLLAMLEIVLENTTFKMNNGNYYVDSKFSLSEYLYQICLWILIVVTTKLISVGLTLLLAHFLQEIGIYLLSPFKGSPKLKLLFVMVISPCILNSIQFWFTDSILQKDGSKLKITKPKDYNHILTEVHYDGITVIGTHKLINRSVENIEVLDEFKNLLGSDI